MTAPSRTTLADFRAALASVEKVLAAGEPIHGDRWRHETPFSHSRHVVAHCEAWREDRQLEDLAHAATRALMALQLALAAERAADDGDCATIRAAGDGDGDA